MFRVLLVASVALGPALVLLASCSQAPRLVGEGAACAVTADCDVGLVCVPQQKGGRLCTADLRSISQTPPQPAPADAARDAPRDGPRDGVASDAPIIEASTPPPDAAPE
ncbi:MAG: hypothetical protein IPG50_04115 [Myxococcales bacterium]|nr:hypothetical protein [Myxococcales bacterium]